ncbi:GNAT family N-acetyltransferase [Marinilabiliaceae bacterium ANBcel2]|nr:GNAT family N-acetyltransferase [Marinilabiliaceae bacterium ANBcel2]
MKIEIEEKNHNSWLKDIDKYNITTFQYPSWLHAVKNSNKEPFFLDFKIGDRVKAKLSGLKIKDHLGIYIYSYAGIMPHNSNNAYEALLYNSYKKLYKYAVKNRYYRVVAACYDYNIKFNNFPKEYYNFKRNEYIIDPKNHEASTDFSSQIKKHLKKCRKKSLTFESSTSPNILATIFTLLNTTKKRRMRRHNDIYNPLYLPFLTKTSLKSLLDNRFGTVYFLKSKENIEAIEFNIELNDRRYTLLKATSEEGYRDGASSALTSKVISKYKEQGIYSYNLGGSVKTDSGDGLKKYKLNIGANEKELFGATTNFIIYPYKLINPVLNITRAIPKNNKVIKTLKKLLQSS